MLESIKNAGMVTLGIILALVWLYIIIRVGTWAWFKSKLQYQKEWRKTNGEEGSRSKEK